MRQAPRVIAVVIALLLVTPASFAKNETFPAIPQASPSWSVDLESPVHWQKVTPLGTLIVLTNEGLMGVDPATGSATWVVPGLANLPEEGCRLLPGTPLLLVSDAGAQEVRIIDSMDGRVVFHSGRAGFAQVTGSHVLFRSGRLLVMGVPRGKVTNAMALFDIASGAKLWMNDDVGGSSGRLMTALAALLDVSEEEMPTRPEPVELDGDAILVDAGDGLMKVDGATGDVLFELSYGEKFFLDPHGRDAVYVGSDYTSTVNGTVESVSSVWRAFRLSDGGEIWDEPVSLGGALNDAAFLEGGLLLSPRTSGSGKVKYVDYESGESLWGKKGRGIKIQGGIVDALVTSRGVALVTGYDNAWTNKGTEYYVNVLDETAGALRFKKAHKMKGTILWTEELPEGLLYVTTHEINILDLTTGQTRYKKSILSEDRLVTAQDGTNLYAFSTKDGLLYRVDRKASTIEAVTKSKVELRDGEAPVALEVRDDGLLLISSQNLVSFGRNGSVGFHAHYPAPRELGWVRALAIANAVRAGMAAAAAGASSAAWAGAAAEQEPGSLGNQVSAGVAQGYGEMAEGYAGLSKDYAELAKRRFSASAVSPDFVFMMVRLSRKEFGLAKVSKATGEIEGMINMQDDREPRYQVDGVSNLVFYRQNGSEILCYRF